VIIALLVFAALCVGAGWLCARVADHRRAIRAMEARAERLRAEREELFGEGWVG
jgi:hypothetical protein